MNIYANEFPQSFIAAAEKYLVRQSPLETAEVSIFIGMDGPTKEEINSLAIALAKKMGEIENLDYQYVTLEEDAVLIYEPLITQGRLTGRVRYYPVISNRENSVRNEILKEWTKDRSKLLEKFREIQRNYFTPVNALLETLDMDYNPFRKSLDRPR